MSHPDALLNVARLGERGAKVVVGSHEAQLESNRLPELPLCVRKRVLLQVRDPQPVVRFGRPGIARKDAPKQSDRLISLTAPAPVRWRVRVRRQPVRGGPSARRNGIAKPARIRTRSLVPNWKDLG